MSLLPEGHEKVGKGNYMEWQDGENIFRVLKEPISGFVYWTDPDGKIIPKGKQGGKGSTPHKFKRLDKVPMEARGATDVFIAAIVWNYAIEKVQILDFKQKTIVPRFDRWSETKDWADFTTYDITVHRTKTGSRAKDVEYDTDKSLPAPVSKEILKAYEESNINLEALYAGDDPFGSIKDVDVDIDEILKNVDN